MAANAIEYHSVAVEAEAFEDMGRLRGGKLSHYVMPWLFVFVPLFVLGFGGYILVQGIRNFSEPCDQPLANMLVAMGALLVAPFILSCLFIPAFMAGSGSDTEDLAVTGGVIVGTLDFVAYVLCLAIATVMYGGVSQCHKPLVESTGSLLIVSWVVFAMACAAGVTMIVKRNSSTVVSLK